MMRLERIKSALRRLNDDDPRGGFELEWLHWHIRLRWFRHKLHLLPFPAKLAIMNGIMTPTVLIFLPDFHQLKPVSVLFVWFQAYCLSLIITAFMPRKKKRVEVHWVN